AKYPFLSTNMALCVVICMAVVFSVSSTEMRNYMDENHQDITESKLIATEDVRWGVNRKSKLWVPKHKKRSGFENKTLWDKLNFLGTLAIPVILALATIGFGWWQAHLAQQQHDTDQSIANQQHQTDQQRALDQQEA